VPAPTLLRPARDLVFRAVAHQRRNAPLTGCILVNGSPRSGTTWLWEWLREAISVAGMSETLNDRRLPEWARRYGFTNRPYRAPDRDDPALEAALVDLFAGRHVVPTIFRPRELPHLLAGRPVLTKLITGNLLLPWLVTRLPALRIIQIVRNPAAMIASQMMYPAGSWSGLHAISPEYDPFLVEHPGYARPQEHFGTLEEVLAAHWAIEHRYLVEQQAVLAPVHVIRYEDLVREPEPTFRGIVRFLGLPWRDALLEGARKPSRSVQKTSALATGGDTTRKFREQLAPDALARIDAILERFGRPFYERPVGAAA
jgi:hypothetical protein